LNGSAFGNQPGDGRRLLSTSGLGNRSKLVFADATVLAGLGRQACFSIASNPLACGHIVGTG
jgi:hypothetical protein